ncbi:alpha-isopropylmalate synthase regulatory domain-containing protein, partial [Streptomyces sp. CNQ085]|uniref:alpha-isopropylmalate synthase regulatory domain-containing protein n=1 Tax=Streptomyces sp. CNQ085 TaxID=2886944 RepID=UPI002674A0D2
IGIDARLLDYTEHTMSEGASARAASYIECAIDGKVLWGIGIGPNTTRASLRAIVSAVNRAYGRSVSSRSGDAPRRSLHTSLAA